MAHEGKVVFINNKATESRPDYYMEILVDVPAVLKSWQQSLFSHEWLSPEGRIKDLKELGISEQSKREGVETALSKGEHISKPVLGIGLLDNVEIGSGKAEFLTLAANGHKQIPVHIPKSNESDFKEFISDVK